MTQQEKNKRLQEIQTELEGYYSRINSLNKEKREIQMDGIEKKYVGKFIKVTRKYVSNEIYMFISSTDIDNQGYVHLYGHKMVIPVNCDDSYEVYFKYTENGDIPLTKDEVLCSVSEISEDEFWKVYVEHVTKTQKCAELEIHGMRNSHRLMGK